MKKLSIKYEKIVLLHVKLQPQQTQTVEMRTKKLIEFEKWGFYCNNGKMPQKSQCWAVLYMAGVPKWKSWAVGLQEYVVGKWTVPDQLLPDQSPDLEQKLRNWGHQARLAVRASKGIRMGEL